MSYPETAALAAVLSARGIHAPNDKPYSESLLLGISGGLGVGYILWEFQAHQIKVLVLAFHNQWQYPAQYYEKLCERIGLKYHLFETGSKKAAAQMLNDHLPVVAWVDRATMPYLQLPAAMQGHLGHFVAIMDKEDDYFYVDDLASQPFKVPADTLEAARARIGSYKNRLLVVESVATPPNLASIVKQGIVDCVNHLSSDSESFSLPAIRKWAKMMTDPKNKKGWPQVFADRRGLFSTLVSLFEAIEFGGMSLRGLYADFLIEAADITGNQKLLEAVEPYRALATRWHTLAEESLPDSHFVPFKQLLRERHAVLMQGGDAWRDTQALSDQLRNLRTENNLNFPLSDSEISELFSTLQKRLQSIYHSEIKALNILKTAI